MATPSPIASSCICAYAHINPKLGPYLHEGGKKPKLDKHKLPDPMFDIEGADVSKATKKAKESKLTTKKRDKRTWTAEEEKLLIDTLYDMNDSSWKVDTGHKSGYLTFIEKEMAKVLPRADLKADPHIKSKSREGAGPLYMKPMLHFDKLCEIYASDLTKGGSAKGPGEQQGVEDFSVLDGDDPVSHHVDKVSLQPQGNENPTAPKGRKRVFADVDTLEASLCNVSNSFAKFLEAEKENGMQMAMMNTVQVQEDTKKTKLLDAIKKLPNFSIEEVVMTVRIIGRDSGNIDLFLTMSPDYQVDPEVSVSELIRAVYRELEAGMNESTIEGVKASITRATQSVTDVLHKLCPDDLQEATAGQNVVHSTGGLPSVAGSISQHSLALTVAPADILAPVGDLLSGDTAAGPSQQLPSEAIDLSADED
uniref:Myb/SANT-like domain-containing protein n=1 Tax=Oryza meridionalis TaxID=40149 RepID=A0A0E0BY13_9ORYZ